MKDEKNKENMHQENNHTMQAICDWTICLCPRSYSVFIMSTKKIQGQLYSAQYNEPKSKVTK